MIRAYHAEAQRAYRDRIRAAVFDHYGRVCACPGCGATGRLTIDHPGGDGNKHRAELFGNRRQGGVPFYRWLIRAGFPAGYVTMCRPCNNSKGDGLACRLWHGDPGKDRCTGPCGQVKDLAQFYPDASRGRRSRSWCRQCMNAADPRSRHDGRT